MKNLKSLRVFVVTAALVCASGVLLYAQTAPRSYYVSVAGDDNNNNGRSEAAPFKTMGKVVEAAKAGVIKTITVIGTYSSKIDIGNTEGDEILITGKPDASAAERAVVASDCNIYGKIRFTHIEMKLVKIVSAVTMGRGAVAGRIILEREQSDHDRQCKRYR